MRIVTLSSLLALALVLAVYPAQSLAQPVAETSGESKDDSTEINVKNADIAAVIRIFAKKTKRNYILDERVKGKVSIYLPGKVSSGESIRILDSVLALKGFSSVPIGDNLWKIVPSKEAIQSTIPTLTDEDGSNPNPTASLVTRLYHLKYVDADAAKQLLSPLVSATGLLNAYTGTNSLIFIDSEDNIERLIRIAQSLDVPSSDREMTIIPIEHADAVDIATKLSEILTDTTDKESATRTSALESIRARLRQTSSRTSTSSAAEGSEPTGSSATINSQGREPKIIADERTNSIIVVADEDMTARIRALISQLDSEVDRSGFRFYVYRCQHANAEELADVLAGLSGDGSSRSSSSQSSVNSFSGQNTGSRERGNRFASTQDRLTSQSRTPGRSRSENSSESSGTTSVQFGENVSITADPATNSLIIYSGKSDYGKILALLKDLDIKRKQVLVEAMILEVRIDEDSNFSTEFLSSAGGKDGGVLAQSTFNNNLATLIQDPTALSNFTVAAASSGTLTLPGDITIPTQTVLLNAAQNNSNVNVLSAPNILATDNEPAEIVVGQNVPFVASTSTSGDNLNNTFNTIDRQDVGITLRLTPQISSSDTVRLDLFTEVSNVVQTSANSDLGPTTTIRTSETTVITKDSQMVVIGGLMSDTVSQVDTGIPFLKDVPVLGHLFRSSSEVNQRTNLLIFITPRIIQNQHDLRDSTITNRDKLDHAIKYNNVQPPRDELLYSEDIDKVTEISPYTGKKPSTIQAPKHPLSPPPAHLSADPQGAARASEDDVIELHIQPKFSSKSEGDAQPKASFNAAHSPTATSSQEQFVILELLSSPDSDLSLPFFSKQGKKGLAGIKLPQGSSVQAKSFF
ncbi:MAG: type II secretion system secretin GspD [Bdellovibrionales bacterium]|nr:type II secretion system secretin GspD [Bdellovibrionales bacterium]